MKPGSRSLKGFTFAETLVTIAVLVLFIGSAVGLSMVTHANQMRSERDQLRQLERISILSILPRLCSSVRPPLWASRSTSFQGEAQALVAHYWEGQADQTVHFEIEEQRLTAVTPDSRWAWGRAELGGLAWWVKDGRVVGLRLSWAEAPDQWIHFAWGGQPL